MRHVNKSADIGITACSDCATPVQGAHCVRCRASIKSLWMTCLSQLETCLVFPLLLWELLKWLATVSMCGMIPLLTVCHNIPREHFSCRYSTDPRPDSVLCWNCRLPSEGRSGFAQTSGRDDRKLPFVSLLSSVPHSTHSHALSQASDLPGVFLAEALRPRWPQESWFPPTTELALER